MNRIQKTLILMAAVAVCIVGVTFPLVLLQRWLLKTAGKYVSVKGKAARQKLLPLGAWKWAAFALVGAWLLFTIVIPLVPPPWNIPGMPMRSPQPIKSLRTRIVQRSRWSWR